MQIKNKLYPYPVLSDTTNDYKNSYFKANGEVSFEGYKIIITFESEISNNELNSLIKSGQAVFAYHVECAQTGYRRVFESNEKGMKILLSHKEVSGKVQICPFVVAKESIPGFTSVNFDDDYKGLSFDIDAGCFMAVGQQFDIFVEKVNEDIANLPSIFSIIKNLDRTCQEFLVEYHSDKITIKMPVNEYQRYKAIYQVPQANAILNSMLIVPVLVFVLEEVSKLDSVGIDDLTTFAWFRSLQNTLLKKFKCDIGKEGLKEKSVELLSLAQRLVDSPFGDALESLENGEEDMGV